MARLGRPKGSKNQSTKAQYTAVQRAIDGEVKRRLIEMRKEINAVFDKKIGNWKY